MTKSRANEERALSALNQTRWFRCWFAQFGTVALQAGGAFRDGEKLIVAPDLQVAGQGIGDAITEIRVVATSSNEPVSRTAQAADLDCQMLLSARPLDACRRINQHLLAVLVVQPEIADVRREPRAANARAVETRLDRKVGFVRSELVGGNPPPVGHEPRTPVMCGHSARRRDVGAHAAVLDPAVE